MIGTCVIHCRIIIVVVNFVCSACKNCFAVFLVDDLFCLARYVVIIKNSDYRWNNQLYSLCLILIFFFKYKYFFIHIMAVKPTLVCFGTGNWLWMTEKWDMHKYLHKNVSEKSLKTWPNYWFSGLQFYCNWNFKVKIWDHFLLLY